MSDPSTLLLNSTFEPIKIISWKRAVVLFLEGKVEVVEEYDDFDLKAVSLTIKCPAVVRLLQFVNGRRHRVKFSRFNVFARDKFTCQYCGNQPGSSNLTYDHVTPRAQGGNTTWENITTCCLPCNSKKGSKTPEQAAMQLLSKPTKPTWSPRKKMFLSIPKTPDCWRNWLYWNSELENDNNL